MEYKINIVLDLDETLIKSITPKSKNEYLTLKQKPNFFFEIKHEKSIMLIFYRPHLFFFLKK